MRCQFDMFRIEYSANLEKLVALKQRQTEQVQGLREAVRSAVDMSWRNGQLVEELSKRMDSMQAPREASPVTMQPRAMTPLRPPNTALPQGPQAVHVVPVAPGQPAPAQITISPQSQPPTAAAVAAAAGLVNQGAAAVAVRAALPPMSSQER